MSHWKPNLTMVRTRDALVVLAELAGLRREEVELTVENQTLVMSGRRLDPFADEPRSLLLDEIPFGEWCAEVLVPQEYDLSRADAVYTNGVLRIQIPLNPLIHRRMNLGIDPPSDI